MNERKSEWGAIQKKVVRKFSIPLLILGFILGYFFYGIIYKHIAFPIQIRTYFLISFFLIFVILISIVLIFEKKIKKFFFGQIDEELPFHSIENFSGNLIEKLLLKNTGLTDKEIKNVKHYTLWILQKIIWTKFSSSSFRLVFALIAAIGAYFTTMLLLEQNNLLKFQNEKIVQQNSLLESQNKKIDFQIHLTEADRRGSLNYLIGNILDKIDIELKSKSNVNRSLSPQLIANIISISQSLKPYRYLYNDTLLSRPLSPERGQLLIALLNSNVDTSSLSRIFRRGTFEFADLEGAVLPMSYLKHIDLNSANLSRCNFKGSDFSFSKLSSDLKNCDLTNCIFIQTLFNNEEIKKKYGTSFALYVSDSSRTTSGFDVISIASPENNGDLMHAKFENTIMDGAYFRNVYLNGIKMSFCNMYDTNIIDSKISGEWDSTIGKLYIINCEITNLILKKASISHSQFYDNDISNSKFSNYDLQCAEISGNTFKETIFESSYPGKGVLIEELKKSNKWN